LLFGTIIHGENLQMLGPPLPEKDRERVTEMPTAICAYVFKPERCFSLIGKSDPSAGKLRFDDSEHPFHRLCGTKEQNSPRLTYAYTNKRRQLGATFFYTQFNC